MEEHWFDALNKALVRQAPRRAVLRSAGALAGGLLLGGVPDGEAAKNKKKRRKKKGKKRPRRPSCGKGPCRREFARKKDREWCEFICGQCRQAGTEFCIINNELQDKVAVCCAEGGTCCGDICCANWPNGEPTKCCGRDRCCAESLDCCPDDRGGSRCTNLQESRFDCGSCGNSCPYGGQGRYSQVCIDGVCRCPSHLRPCDELGRCIHEHEVC